MSRKIDAAIAEYVMGYKVKYDDLEGYWYKENNSLVNVPNYSTDIKAAWEVVKKMSGRTWILHLWETCGNDWFCEFKKVDMVFESIADTAPLAICKAALKAKGIEVEEQGE